MLVIIAIGMLVTALTLVSHGLVSNAGHAGRGAVVRTVTGVFGALVMVSCMWWIPIIVSVTDITVSQDNLVSFAFLYVASLGFGGFGGFYMMDWSWESAE